MKIKIFSVIILFAFSLMLFPAQDEEFIPKPSKALQIDYTVGLNFSFNKVAVLVGNNNLSNSLNFSYLALELDVGISDYLTLGAVAGYNSNYMKDPVDFNNLPLSLQLQDETFNSMVLGVRAKSEFLSWKDFSFAANAEYLYFKRLKKEFPIELPIVTGEAIVKNSFTQLSVELWAQYEGFSNFTLFAGPQLNLLKGKFNVSEEISDLNAEEELSYKQENKLGVAAGVLLEVSSHIDVNLKINLISKNSFSIGAIYVF